jgi:hypothetical protein
VHQEFGFLRTLGFKEVVVEETATTYALVPIAVVVYWEPRSGELSARFLWDGVVSRKPESFELVDVLALLGKADVQKWPTQVTDESRLPHWLHELSEAVRIAIEPLLARDLMFMRRVEVARVSRSEKLMEELGLAAVKRQADDALSEGHLLRFVGLLEPIKRHLNLEYQRKLKLVQMRLKDKIGE